MQVNVINENNVEVSIDPPQTIVVEVDQGKQGRGITNISYQQEGEYYYLVVTYTDGTTEQLGPLVITGAAVSLLGGTAGAIAYQTAPDNTGFIALGAQNQVLVAGPTAPQYTSSLTGLTVNNSAIGNTTPSTGAFTNLSASGAFSLTGDQVQISEGGTGQTTANAAFNALAPSQTGNSGKYLKTDGTNTSWDQLDISTADITGTLAVTNGGTGATNAADARTNLNAASQSTTISAGTGLTGGGDLSANRTLNIANTTVTAGAYGSASDTLTATVNAQGQLTALAATPIAIANTQISGLGTMSTQNANSVSITGGSITGITDLAVADGGTGASNAADARTNLGAAASATTISAGTGLTGGGDLSANRTISIANTTVTAGAYGSASNTLTATVNAQGQLTALSATPIAIANTQVSGLGTMSTQNSNSVTVTGGSITGITDLAIADGGTGASTAADARANLGLGSAAVLNAGVANGVATLDSGGTVPLSQLPASIQGGVSYQGSWDAATNTPTLTSSVGSKGYYYVVSVAGSTNLNGVTDWLPGDWAIFNGSVWQKIDNTDAVASVNGYTGVVVLSAADVGAPPTSRTISAGTGLTGGGDLSTNRTISIDNTTVSAGSYGSASSVGTFTVNGQGQLTAAASTPIAITNTQVSGLGTMSTQNANSVSITGGSITGITDLAVADGGTGASDAASARTNLGAAASGANSDITSLSGITGAIGTADYVAFDTTYTTTLAAGQLGWDGNNTLGLGMAGGNVVQKIGEDQFYYIKASSAITKGQVVMFTGSVGASGVVTGAPATGITDGSYIMGIAAETIALNGFGLVQFEGTLRGIDTSAFTDGAILWYNPAVTGGLTATQPSAPNVKVQMAAVINAGSGGSGSILIRVTAGSVLGGTDSNVQFSTLVNGNIIQYDSALGYWKNVAPTSVAVTTFSGGTTGLTPATATAGDVTLGGTLAVANGGTGVTTSTGTGSVVLATSPTLVTPALGTPTSGNFSTGTFTWPTFNQNTTGTASNITATSNSTLTTLSSLSLPGSQVTGNISGNSANVTGVIAIANGGTGQTTANAAFNALAPSQTGNAGKYLTTDGTNTSWATNPLGTVTSVAVSGGTTGLTTSGGPITTSGTITLAGTLATTNGGTGLTSFTANGVVYASSTSALTTGSALTFDGTSLAVGGVPTVQGELNVFKTGAAPTLYVQGDTGNSTTQGIIRIGGSVGRSASIQGFREASSNLQALRFYSYNSADQLSYEITSGGTSIWSVGGSEAMRLTSTGLGIGTSSPTSKLDVVGRITVTNAQAFFINGATGTYGTIAYNGTSIGDIGTGNQVYSGGGTTDLGIAARSGYRLVLGSNGNQHVYLDTFGNLGIGTSSPATRLAVGNTSSQNTVRVNGSNTADQAPVFSMFRSAAVEAAIWTSNDVNNGFGFAIDPANYTDASLLAATKMSLTRGGNLGLGVTPSAWNSVYKALDIANGGISANTTNTEITFNSNVYRDSAGNYIYKTTNSAARFAATAGAYQWYIAPSGTAGTAISFTQAMTLDASGNLGIGTTSPGAKLDVRASNTEAAFYIGNSTAGSSTLRATWNSNNIWLRLFSSAGNEVVRFATNTDSYITSGNLGIGTSSPVAKLQVAGDIVTNISQAINWNTYSSGGDKYIANGYAFQMYFDSTGAWRLLNAPQNSSGAGAAAVLTERMRLDSSGNLGIGTSSPDKKLVISGAGSQFMKVVDTTNSVNAFYGVFNSAAWLGTGTNHNVTIATNDTIRATFDTSGNLGLGVTPSAWSGYKAIQVNEASLAATTGSNTALTSNGFYDGTSWKYIYSNFATRYLMSSGAHQWYTSPSGTAGNAISWTQAMTLDASGRLGVGTTSPTGIFEACGGSSYFRPTGGAGTFFQITAGAANGDVTLIASANSGGYPPLLFNVGGSERARIDSSGNLLVGTTDSSPIGNGVKGIVLNGTDARFDINRNGNCPMFLGRYTSTGDMVQFYYAGVSKGSISTDGTNVAYNTSSDYRLKNNPQPLTGSGAFIDALKPKTWNWKTDGSKGVGFIAHEVQEVSPGSVVGEKDAVDEEGNPIMQAMEYGSAEFIANIVAELQSLRARVAQLESKGA